MTIKAKFSICPKMQNMCCKAIFKQEAYEIEENSFHFWLYSGRKSDKFVYVLLFNAVLVFLIDYVNVYRGFGVLRQNWTRQSFFERN